VRRVSARRPKTHSRSRSVAAAIAPTVGAAAVAFVLTGGDAGILNASTASVGPVAGHADTVIPNKRTVAAVAALPDDSLTWPLRGAVTGRFGEERSGHVHEGIDIPAPMGTPITAASGGEVVLREPESGYGKYTCIAHRKIMTCYGHQSRFRTKVGATVRRGEVIGYVGNTGNAPAIHLHFEVRRGRKPWGAPVNPLRYLPPRQ
jgi:murein DD-endopeptidase MepM/ murein hydrolase activator NlpD